MILTPWVGFISPIPSRYSLWSVVIAAATTATIAFPWRDRGWRFVLLTPFALFFPAMIASDLLAHLLFNGCVLY